jgi:hypothetical protein
VVLAGAPAADVVLAGTGPDVGAGGGPDGGARAAPGIICAMAKCCCNGKMLGQIANSSNAPILETMPKETRDVIPQYRECQLYKELSLIGNPLSKILENGKLRNNAPSFVNCRFFITRKVKNECYYP